MDFHNTPPEKVESLATSGSPGDTHRSIHRVQVGDGGPWPSIPSPKARSSGGFLFIA